MATDARPPRPQDIEDAFMDAIEDADSMEDARWVVWLYDALESGDRENAKWRGSVLWQKGYNDLVHAVDAEFGGWLDGD